MIYPDWKIKAAEKLVSGRWKNKSTSNVDICNLADFLQGNCKNPNTVKIITELYDIYRTDHFIKETLEACLLCDDASMDDVVSVVGMPKDIIEIYTHYFFDTSVFKYRLHRYEYIRTYNNPDFADGKLFKTWAVNVGMKFFKWKFKVMGHQIVPREILLDLVGDTFFRGKEHINEPITSAVTRESLRWLKQASDSLSAIDRMKSDTNEDALTTFRISLEYDDNVKKVDDISDAEIIS